MKNTFLNHSISYPIRFNPIIKERIWGGTKLRDLLNKDLGDTVNAGESWEISTVEGNVSIIANGSLAGVSLLDALIQYGKEILGSPLFDKFGVSFPLLIKFLDARSDLSIQVHPDDQMALQRHNCKGKTEMWYIMDAEDNSTIICGLSKSISKKEFITKVEDGSLPAVLQKIRVNTGDSFFIPSGRIHALGAGIVLAEVQQASDITYRIFDYDRIDQEGSKRELHIQLALDAIDFKISDLNKTKLSLNEFTTNLAKCDFFITNLINVDKELEFDHSQNDRFTILICVEGIGTIGYNGVQEPFCKGDTLLLPACLSNFSINSSGIFKVLEVYI